MTNAQAARIFEEIAVLLEIQGEDAFRVNTYRKVARTVEDLASDINDVAARGELAKLPGIGKASAEKLSELLTTGRLALREELRQHVPDTLLELLRVPSLGPRKAALLWREVGVTSLAELKTAIDNGKLVGLKGFGAKTIEHFKHGIEFLESTAGRVRIGKAWPMAIYLRDAMRAQPGVSRCELAGSLRRGAETIGDLDLLCSAVDGPAAVRAFTAFPGVLQVLAAGDTKGSVLIELGNQRVQVDLRVVPADSFGAAWQYFTGSKQHNVGVRERAVKRGWTLNEYGLYEGERVIASKTEEDIYAAMGLPWYPPELREDRFEFDLSAVPHDLISLDHIRGDLHMHTTASDGRNSIAEMVAAAKARGYEIVCITDHSQSSAIANGLKPDRLMQHIRDVREVARRITGITVWVGAEVDILAEGRLDYGDDVLEQLDFVVASVHVGMSQDRELNTRRTLAAIRNPFVNLIAHPSGRLINRREAMPLDVETIAKEAARTGTSLEINASTYRLDLKDQHARLARDLGAKICIDTDAHSTDQLDQMPFGVMTARRAGLLRGDVLNAQGPEAIREFVLAKRRHSAR
ncbi:MAG: DNA polymerase/3'-5' exonuclease PolX [Phycisphaerales bacterium]|nr:DNA polymerase/3'-5' exonuclease PolX [Phycisphaerales bacterium]